MRPHGFANFLDLFQSKFPLAVVLAVKINEAMRASCIASVGNKMDQAYRMTTFYVEIICE
jgi:hypothetical protein